jgi:putative ABC transport system permease protein
MSHRDDIDAELQFHLDSRVRDLIADGLTPEQAAAQADREFGNRLSFSNECLDIRKTAAHRRERRDYWHGWRNDLRYGLRAIVRAPLFSIAAVSILTLGIGLTSTVFAVVHGVFLNPLPYPQSRELYRVYAVNVEKDTRESPMSAGDFFALRDALAPGVSIGGYMNWPASLTGVADPERLNGALASADLFKTLGVNASEGRTFVLEDENPSSNVVVISTRLAARLGLAGHAEGATVELNRQPATVVGVMPASFQFPQANTDVWIPLSLRPADRHNHSSRWLHTIARIEVDGIASARDRLATAMARLALQFPSSNAGWSASLVPLHDVVIGRAGSTLVFLVAAIACVLLVMVVNLATLVTSRLQRRTNDLSVHQALGADRWRLLRQLATECLVLTIAGATLGLLLASGLVGSFQRVAGNSVPRADEVTVSAWIVAFAGAVALLGLSAMTVLPLGRALAAAVSPLAQGGRGAASTRSPRRLLVVTQSALACVLMVAAALLVQTYLRLADVDLGFRPENVLTMRIALPPRTPPAQQAAYFKAVTERVRSVPGVMAAGAASDLPLSGNSLNVPIAVGDSVVAVAPDTELRAAFRVITPQYLETIGTVTRGRTFNDGDMPGRQAVALVNEAFVRTHWPGREAIGMRARTSEDRDWRTVVGVVRDVHHAGPTGHEGPTIYVPHAQKSEAFLTWMSLAVRTTTEPVAMAAALRAAIADVDRHQPVSDVRLLTELVDTTLALPRLAATVAAVAALGSLVLAALGVGAVLSILVNARTPDLAVRLALGARPSRLKWAPVAECLTLVGTGGALGLLVAAAMARLIRSLLYGISPLDPATFAISLLVLLGIAIAAAIGPSRAVARIDPAMTLRS